MMGVVLFFALIVSPPIITLANWGLVYSLPADSGDAVDAIVVLGRGPDLRERRVEIAEELWKAKRSSYIFASGMLDAQQIVERLRENGLPKQRLAGEACSQTTEENAQFTSVFLQPQKIEKILLVTDPPHMLRSLLLFQSFGFTVIPSPTSLPLKWSTYQQMQLIIREYAALANYKLTGRFKPRTANELKYLNVQATTKITNWNCKI
ncbi:MAG: YdcF family protein [Leptolyngbyaceae cyanobacterium bins.349]|nr:YdcF family protein [Leptolyngbyaceae cyanobacterium bins.349]